MKVMWALGGTVGLSNPVHYHSIENGYAGLQRFFDYWGTPILAGVAVVILLGLVYPWGNAPLLRPILRTLAWAGSLVGIVGVAGLILTIRDYVIPPVNPWHDLNSGTYVFTYVCFMMVGLGFGASAWLTRHDRRS